MLMQLFKNKILVNNRKYNSDKTYLYGMFFLFFFGIISIEDGDKMLEEYLLDNNLIICPNPLKEKIIKEINKYRLVSHI